MTMQVRIKELRRVKASELVPHPENWRVHGSHQRQVMTDLLEKLGFVGAVIARELEDGRLQTLDGHLRAEEAGDEVVPVLVLDLNDDEARLFLATADPLRALATADAAKLKEVRARAERTMTSMREDIAGLLHKTAAQLVPAGDRPGRTPQELWTSYVSNPMKQIVVYIEGDQYARVLEQLDLLMTRTGSGSYSEAWLKLVEEAV
jgi:ParB-like chromosome segregation protein Spo0J